jgi:hypothetical protein
MEFATAPQVTSVTYASDTGALFPTPQFANPTQDAASGEWSTEVIGDTTANVGSGVFVAYNAIVASHGGLDVLSPQEGPVTIVQGDYSNIFLTSLGIAVQSELEDGVGTFAIFDQGNTVTPNYALHQVSTICVENGGPSQTLSAIDLTFTDGTKTPAF